MPYSAELRETVVRKALAREMSQEELARTHGVSKSSVQQWLRKARERGDKAMVHGEDRRARDWSAEERFAAPPAASGTIAAWRPDALGARGHVLRVAWLSPERSARAHPPYDLGLSMDAILDLRHAADPGSFAFPRTPGRPDVGHSLELRPRQTAPVQ